MKSDNRRLGWFRIAGLERMRDIDGMAWVFEGFVPMRVQESFNTDAVQYFGYHPDFDVTREGGFIPEYVASRVDGKTVWRRVTGEVDRSV